MILGLTFLSSTALALDCVVPDLERQAHLVRELARDRKLDEAQQRVREVEQSLLCQEDIIDRTALVHFFQAASDIARASGDHEAQRDWWDRALVIDASISFTDPLYSDARVEYDEHRALYDRRPPVETRGADGAYVDGRPLGCDRTLDLQPGEHVVQWTASDGSIVTRLETVSGEGPVELGPDIALRCPEQPAARTGPSWTWIGAGGAGIVGGGALMALSYLSLQAWTDTTPGTAEATGAWTRTVAYAGGGVVAFAVGGGMVGHGLTGRKSAPFTLPLVTGRW